MESPSQAFSSTGSAGPVVRDLIRRAERFYPDKTAVVCGNERWGEAVKAIVVLRPGMQASAEELINHCHARIAGYKCPRSVEFLDALPKNAAGKLLKRELRDAYWRGYDRRIN